LIYAEGRTQEAPLRPSRQAALEAASLSGNVGPLHLASATDMIDENGQSAWSRSLVRCGRSPRAPIRRRLPRLSASGACDAVKMATFRAVSGGEISATRPHGDAEARLIVTIRVTG
jgi:hypothetical protein